MLKSIRRIDHRVKLEGWSQDTTLEGTGLRLW